MSRLCEVYPGISLTTEENAWKNLSQDSRILPVGTMKTEYTEQNIHNKKNTYNVTTKIHNLKNQIKAYRTYKYIYNN
jgi:hypothetical protein